MRLFDSTRASALMDEQGIDLVLANSPANVGYLADYAPYINNGHPFLLDGTEDRWTGNMVGVPREEEKEAFFVGISFEETLADYLDFWIRDRRYWGTRFVYQGRAEQHAYHEDLVDTVVEAIRDRGLADGTIAVEMGFLPVDRYLRLREFLPGATFVDAAPLLWRLRLIKSPDEIRRIRKVARATDAAVDAAYDACYAGMPELEFQRIIKQAMSQEGIDYAWSSVAFGPKGTLLVMATENRLKPGEVARTDACGRFQGYFSDISRVRTLGEPSDEAKRAHEAIYTANRKLVEAAQPGVRCCDLFWMLAEHLEQAGYECLSQQAGHGFGRDVHEPPMLTARNGMLLQPNMVLVLEPTMRVVGVGSINVEDMILITEEGNEPLTSSVRELVPCGVVTA
jgi:Xaa-Pro dipeptidase